MILGDTNNPLFREMLEQRLMILATTKDVTPEQYARILKTIHQTFEDWKEQTLAQLQHMALDWEETMGETDKTLYSLGIRRAIDTIQEESALAQLPILETPETKLDVVARAAHKTEKQTRMYTLLTM